MKEKELIALWDSKRNQIVMTQLAPSIVLATAFVLSSLGLFTNATHQAKYFALGVVGVTGILAAITTFGIIRESEAIIEDLKNEKDLSSVGKKISESRELVMLNLAVNFIMSAGVFALAAWAILK
jgi:predicted nucleic acid-binding protein